MATRRTDEELELRYTTGPRISQHELAKWGGVSRGHISKLSAARDWKAKREQFRASSVEKARQDRVADVAASLEQFHDTARRVALGLMERIEQRMDRYTNADSLRKLTSALKDCLQAGNLAHGEPTKITKNVDEALRELEADLGDGLDGAL